MLESSLSQSDPKFLGITPINIPKEKLDSLREFIKFNKFTNCVKSQRMKDLVGGWCVICYLWFCVPTKIASYDYSDVTRIELYVIHVQKAVYDLKVK